MTTDFSDVAVSFRHGDVEVGRYVLDDPYKPHLHPLRTVDGDVASLAIAHDHRHHKGLMFAFQTNRGNFWEETPRPNAPIVGRQRSVGVRPVAEGDWSGFEQDIDWHTDEGSVFSEMRTILCAVEADAVRWKWRVRLAALQDVTLEQSEWSAPDAAGQLINYHGLGLRFPRAFEVAGEQTYVVIKGKPRDPAAALGVRAPAVTFSGPTDGTWPPRRVEVTLGQEGREDAFFAARAPLSYLAVGPSNTSAVNLGKGEVFEGQYNLSVRAMVPQK